MKITKVESYSIPLVLREHYTIAYHTVTSVTNVGLMIHTSDGLTGVGISGPEEEVTGETADTVLKAAKEIIEPFLIGRDISDVRKVIRELDPILGSMRAALALVDTALFDYAAKKAGVPLHTYLGSKRNSLQTAITVYIHPPEETVRRCKNLLQQGYKILKVKGGLNPEEDLFKLKLLRKEIGQTIPIILDLNQGYSQEQVNWFYKEGAGLNIQCIEQPSHKNDKAFLCTLAARNEIPVMVDESLVTTDDAEYFGSSGVQYFNLKLMKAGGILATQELDAVASKYKTKVITSCMDEAALANVYGLAFSLASPNVDFVDLDSFTDYAEDPTRHLLNFKDGVLYW